MSSLSGFEHLTDFTRKWLYCTESNTIFERWVIFIIYLILYIYIHILYNKLHKKFLYERKWAKLVVCISLIYIVYTCVYILYICIIEFEYTSYIFILRIAIGIGEYYYYFLESYYTPYDPQMLCDSYYNIYRYLYMSMFPYYVLLCHIIMYISIVV